MAMLDIPQSTNCLIEQALRPLKDEGVPISRVNLLRDTFHKVYYQGLMAVWKLDRGDR